MTGTERPRQCLSRADRRLLAQDRPGSNREDLTAINAYGQKTLLVKLFHVYHETHHHPALKE